MCYNLQYKTKSFQVIYLNLLYTQIDKLFPLLA